jgi:phosphate transport system ATP-binding protein
VTVHIPFIAAFPPEHATATAAAYRRKRPGRNSEASGSLCDAGFATEPGDETVEPTSDDPMPAVLAGFDIVTEGPSPVPESASEIVFELRDVAVRYGGHMAVEGVSLDIASRQITALIGPSGCGKSTILRCLNRMNDLVPGAAVEGKVQYHGHDLYAGDVDPVEVRRRIGMVFQKPNPFPKSIFDNVAFGPRLRGHRRDVHEVVERALTRAALWDEVKDQLKRSAFALSGGQQQRLCIARAIAVEPEVILMDEPCSALDPIATSRIEDLMAELKLDYTIVIVTHNMQQAARVSDRTAFMTAEIDDAGQRVGRLVEFDDTRTMFTHPSDPRTEGYITGRFG